jgi:hypothetical protein
MRLKDTDNKSLANKQGEQFNCSFFARIVNDIFDGTLSIKPQSGLIISGNSILEGNKLI